MFGRYLYEDSSLLIISASVTGKILVVEMLQNIQSLDLEKTTKTPILVGNFRSIAISVTQAGVRDCPQTCMNLSDGVSPYFGSSIATLTTTAGIH